MNLPYKQMRAEKTHKQNKISRKRLPKRGEPGRKKAKHKDNKNTIQTRPSFTLKDSAKLRELGQKMKSAMAGTHHPPNPKIFKMTGRADQELGELPRQILAQKQEIIEKRYEEQFEKKKEKGGIDLDEDLRVSDSCSETVKEPEEDEEEETNASPARNEKGNLDPESLLNSGKPQKRIDQVSRCEHEKIKKARIRKKLAEKNFYEDNEDGYQTHSENRSFKKSKFEF